VLARGPLASAFHSVKSFMRSNSYASLTGLPTDDPESNLRDRVVDATLRAVGKNESLISLRLSMPEVDSVGLDQLIRFQEREAAKRATICETSAITMLSEWPLFEWIPSKTANAYRVEVRDAGFHQAAKSDNLPATTHAWTPSTQLKRGMVYTWVVRVIKSGTESGAVSSASQG